MSRWNGLAKAEVMEAVCPRVMSMSSWRGRVLYLRFFHRLPTELSTNMDETFAPEDLAALMC